MTDKRLCADLLKKAGCPTPAIREAYDGKRLIWKPRIGAGGRGVRIVDSQADVPEGDGLLFDFVDGREYTVDFLAYKGALVCAAQRERLMTRGGVCTIATVDPLGEAVERGLTAIIDTVGYDGPGCFQFISNRDTGMWWTDLNPRVGGGTGMTVEAEPMDVPPVMPCHVVRYFTEILV
jgi:predicted ATP-grasp superfamily ATP-dependent carboligase